MTCKPFVKWVGGKTQILDKIHSHIPDIIKGMPECNRPVEKVHTVAENRLRN